MAGEWRLRAPATWLLRFALLAALWLALTDSVKAQELAFGAVAAAAGATLSGLIARPGRPRTAPKTAGLASLGPATLLRPLWALVRDSFVVSVALLRSLLRGRVPSGSFRVARHRPPPPLRSAAGRAAAELLGSLGPNRYVVGIDEERDVVLVHELVASDEPLDPLARR